MSKRKPGGFTGWQRQLISELSKLAEQHPDELRITKRAVRNQDGSATVHISLRAVHIPQVPGGLELRDDEEFAIRIQPAIFVPPEVEVDHFRFLGFPHVLQGQRLCIYLDPSREWHPETGMAGLLNRLWNWLNDAAGAQFDPSAAMYHAVGGVLHRSDRAPTIVVREEGKARRCQTARLIVRSDHRFDLTYAAGESGFHVPVFRLDSALPFGATTTFASMLALIDDPYLDRSQGRLPRIEPQSSALITALAASAMRNPDNTNQYFVLAVPYPMGGPSHLLGGRLHASVADQLRTFARRSGTAITIDPAKVDAEIPIEWCTMSDERQQISTRRDNGRPVNGLQGRNIHIWGCGGLGSWIAEFAARAGASEITLCDPGFISGGLLARQNYTEEDIGRSKVQALAGRLRSIRDGLVVTVYDGAIPQDSVSCLTADLVIDATVSNSITQYLDVFAMLPDRKAIIAQVATDAMSGTLGILNICASGASLIPSKIDQEAGIAITAMGELEIYHGLWQEPLDGHELTPTRGCSVPTFHGSAADLAAVAATLVNLLGSHLVAVNSRISGTHLIALPYAAGGPHHYFFPAVVRGEADIHI